MSRLLSPELSSQPKCVDFWYQIVGNEQCDLIVRTVSRDNVTSSPFFTRNKDYGSEWHLAEFDISSVATDFLRVALEGQVKSDWQGYVAIDDIKIENRQCRPPGFCTFEFTPRLCTWMNVEGEIKN